jgi:hypothetical protein
MAGTQSVKERMELYLYSPFVSTWNAYKVNFTCFYKLWYTEEHDAGIYFLWCIYISLSWITSDGRLCCMHLTSKMSVLWHSFYCS